jgi:hypothetical protein
MSPEIIKIKISNIKIYGQPKFTLESSGKKEEGTTYRQSGRMASQRQWKGMSAEDALPARMLWRRELGRQQTVV